MAIVPFGGPNTAVSSANFSSPSAHTLTRGNSDGIHIRQSELRKTDVSTVHLYDSFMMLVLAAGGTGTTEVCCMPLPIDLMSTPPSRNETERKQAHPVQLARMSAELGPPPPPPPTSAGSAGSGRRGHTRQRSSVSVKVRRRSSQEAAQSSTHPNGIKPDLPDNVLSTSPSAEQADDQLHKAQVRASGSTAQELLSHHSQTTLRQRLVTSGPVHWRTCMIILIMDCGPQSRRLMTHQRHLSLLPLCGIPFD